MGAKPTSARDDTPNVAVVIVNYRTPQLVIDCLKSLQGVPEESLSLEIFIGDAQSGDGSVETIRAFIDEAGMSRAKCFDIGVNGGFAYGNNYIVDNCVLPRKEFRYVHFLNPDTYIRPGAVTHLVEFLEGHPDVAVAGSRLENPDGSLRAFGFNFPTPWREFFRGARLPLLPRLAPATEVYRTDVSRTQEVDWVTGASFMVRRTVLEEVGLMDSGYFLYFEEVDWMRRIRDAGHKIFHVAESHVVHLGGQATGVQTNERAKPISSHWLHSRSKFFSDHFGRAGVVAANTLFLYGDALYRLHRRVRLKPVENPPGLWRTYLWGNRREGS